jgi:S1-C subfamily serine protease
VAAPNGGEADYVAVILRSNAPLWEPGEIKAEIRGTASPDVFTCTYFMGNKKPAGTTLTFDHDSVLRASVITTPTGPLNVVLVRVWPTIPGESAHEASAKGGASGTGFLLSRSGLMGTNWHVVADAKNVSVAFPGWNGSAAAEVVIRDKVNDLALLRVSDSARLTATC